MELFFRISAGALVTVILSALLVKEGRVYAILLSLAVCAMIFVAAAAYFQPILSFLERLIYIGDLHSNVLGLLLKIGGIGLVSQLASMICVDAGNVSLMKVLQIITTAAILWITLPLLEELLAIIEEVLEAV